MRDKRMAAWQLLVLLGLVAGCNCSRLGPALVPASLDLPDSGAPGDARPAAQQDAGVIEYEEYADVDDRPRRSSYVLEDPQGHLTVVEQTARPIPGGQVFTQRTSNGDGSFSVTTVSSSSIGSSSSGSRASTVTPPPAAALQVHLMPAHTLGLLQQLTQGMLPALTSPLNDMLGALEAQQQRLSGLLVARYVESAAAAAAASQQLDQVAAAANAAAAEAAAEQPAAVPCPQHQAMLAAAAAAAAASQQPAGLAQAFAQQQQQQQQQAAHQAAQVWLEELDATLDAASSASDSPSSSASSSSMRDPLLLSGVAADGSRYLDTYEDDASYDDDSNEPADTYDAALDALSAEVDGEAAGDDVQLDAFDPWFAMEDVFHTHRQQRHASRAAAAAAAAASPLEAVAAWWQELGGDRLLLLLLVACTGAVLVSFLVNLVQLRAAMAAAAAGGSGKGRSGGSCPLVAAAAAGLATVSAVAVAGARSVNNVVNDVSGDVSDDDDLEIPLLLDADEDDACCPPWQLPAAAAAAAPAPAAGPGPAVQHFYNPLYYQHLPGKM